MLRALRVGNLALVDELNISFEAGLTMLTGETGAGKSMIAGALALLTGVKADRELIRAGEELAWVEGLFDLADAPDSTARLAALGVRVDSDGVLVLRRELKATGRGRVLINGLVSSLALLEQAGNLLLSVQSQDQRRLMGRPSFAMDLLDDVLGLAAERGRVRQSLAEVRQLTKELSARRQEDEFARQQLEMWEYQYRELNGMGLDEAEESELAEQLAVGRNARQLLEGAGRARDLLTEGEGAAQAALGQAESILLSVGGKSKALDDILGLLQEADTALVEAGRRLERFLDGAVADPAKLDEMEERKAQYEDLRRKYDRDVAGLIELERSLAERLSRQRSAADNLQHLHDRLVVAREELVGAAVELRHKRQAGAAEVAARAGEVIRPLALPDLELEFAVTPRPGDADGLEIEGISCEVLAHGADQVKLLARTNRGEKRGEVGEIASGGEQSRIFLGLSVLSGGRGGAPLLLFDEIDAGLGMDKALPVADLLAELAKEAQVLCITHLATVAARGQQHMRAQKSVSKGRTVLQVSALGEAERLAEIARLLGGDKVGAGAAATGRLTYAKQLLARG